MKHVHTPVLLREAVASLDPQPGKRFIDATLGGGGHTMALLEKGADVVGIDRDAMILAIAGKRIADSGYTSHFTAVHSTFADALSIGDKLSGKYDGILFDLGVSSLQLDRGERGFSFMQDAPLDMRMDDRLQVTAADLINGLGKKELSELFSLLGEERAAKKIATAIADRRKLKPIRRTLELAQLIESVVPRTGHLHPATKVFQALRMAVNSEREELKAALPSALSWLGLDAVLAVISFHSLEDVIVKDFMQFHEKSGDLSIDKRSPIKPADAEIARNPRSRSARLRIATCIRSNSI